MKNQGWFFSLSRIAMRLQFVHLAFLAVSHFPSFQGTYQEYYDPFSPNKQQLYHIVFLSIITILSHNSHSLHCHTTQLQGRILILILIPTPDQLCKWMDMEPKKRVRTSERAKRKNIVKIRNFLLSIFLFRWFFFLRKIYLFFFLTSFQSERFFEWFFGGWLYPLVYHFGLQKKSLDCT